MARPDLSLRPFSIAAEVTPSKSCIHLILRGRRAEALVQDDEDWQVLSVIAERVLFWCGGWIHGCRCEGNELRFAVEAAYASVGSMVSHISGPYALHLRRRRGWTGSVFKRYSAIVLDAELYLDDLVIWLHRPPPGDSTARANPCWTADAAYRIPNSVRWITTARVLDVLGGSSTAAYQRRLVQPIAPEIVKALTRSSVKRRQLVVLDRRRHGAREKVILGRPNFKRIAQIVAAQCGVSYESMYSQSRKRAIVKAKAIAAVLSTRYGASAAAMARLFSRSRSTLIERVEHYRKTQPALFADAERTLEAHLDDELGRDSEPSNEEGMVESVS
jgi:hypothetical protein